MSAFAEYESDVRSDYAKTNAEHAARLGRPNGMAPFGYRYKGKGLGLEVVEVKARIVRHIFTAYTRGEPILAIARKLDAKGYRSPRGKHWNSDFLSELDPDLIHRLVEQAIPLDLEAGAMLYPEEGDPGWPSSSPDSCASTSPLPRAARLIRAVRIGHVFADCPTGMQILPQHRRNGTNDSSLCGVAETCIAGLPVLRDKSDALPAG